jgi:hypothetical protein
MKSSFFMPMFPIPSSGHEIAPGNQLTAPDKHKNLCARALKTALVYSVNEI